MKCRTVDSIAVTMRCWTVESGVVVLRCTRTESDVWAMKCPGVRISCRGCDVSEGFC